MSQLCQSSCRDVTAMEHAAGTGPSLATVKANIPSRSVAKIHISSYTAQRNISSL